MSNYYIDPGVIATDAQDGDLSSSVSIVIQKKDTSLSLDQGNNYNFLIVAFGGLTSWTSFQSESNVNFPFTRSQKIVSFFNIFPISYPIIIPPIAGASMMSMCLKLFLIFFANDLQIDSAR